MQIPTITPVNSSERAAPTDQHRQQKHAPAFSSETDTKQEYSRFEAIAEDGNEIVYRAVDPETGLVLAQVPSEEVRRVAKRLEEMMAEGAIK